jgi:tetratricopeptide (TPR) repeat protein
MYRTLFVIVTLSAGIRAQTQLSQSDQDFITNHFDAAKQAEALHQFPNAIKEYELILKQYPSAVPEIYQNLGLLYYLGRDYENAIRVFERGIHWKPAMPGAQLFLGSAYLTKGRPQLALPHLQYAYKSQPNAESAIFLGLCLNALRRYSEANQYYRTALAGSDEKAYCLHLLGNSYLKLSEQVANSLSEHFPDSKYEHLVTAKVVDAQEWYQIAAKEYLESGKRDPMNASLFFPLARWLAVLGEDKASEMAFARYRQLMPFDEDAKIDRAGLPQKEMANVGITVDYIAELSALPKVDPKRLPPVPMLPAEVNGKLVAKVNSAKWRDAASAIVSFRWEAATEQLNAIPASPNDWLRDYVLASVWLWRGDSAKAEEVALPFQRLATAVPVVEYLRWDIYRQRSYSYFQRLLDEYPQSAWAHFLRGRTLDAQGKLEAADEYLAAIAADPKLPEVHISLADLYLSNSKVDEALSECQKELELNPDSNLAKARLGRIYVELRDTAKAIPYLQQALAEDPDDAGARADLARGLELRGETDKAITEYERALKLDPSLNRLRYVLARLYRKTGKPEHAQREYQLFHLNEATARQQYLDRLRKLRELDNTDRAAAAGSR